MNNRISTTKTIGNLLTDYEPHKADPLYQTVMDIIVRANKKKFEEVHSEMCDALMELMKEELEDARDSGRDEGRNEGIQALIIMRCDSDSGKKLIKSMVLRTADRQGMC